MGALLQAYLARYRLKGPGACCGWLWVVVGVSVSAQLQAHLAQYGCVGPGACCGWLWVVVGVGALLQATLRIMVVKDQVRAVGGCGWL